MKVSSPRDRRSPLQGFRGRATRGKQSKTGNRHGLMEEYGPFSGCFHKEMTLCILVAQKLPLISLWLNSRAMFAVGSVLLSAST